MKLRLVKFFTSRENEIEKKEEGGRRINITCSTTLIQASARAHARSVLALLFPSSFHPFLPLPPPSPQPAAPACLPPRAAKQLLQLSLSSCSAFPFLLHKITEAARYGIRRVALYSTCRPSLLVQLAGLAIAAPSSPHPCLFTKSGGRGSSPVLMASSLWRVEPQENKGRK